jgi:hypothetical protein
MAPKKAHEGGLRTVIVAWVGDVVSAVVRPHGPNGAAGPLRHLVRRSPDDGFPSEGERAAYPLRPVVRALPVRAPCAGVFGSLQTPSGRRRWDAAPSRCRRANADLRGIPLQPPGQERP